MIARTRGLTYRYPSSSDPSLLDVDLDIQEGDEVLVTGPSAGGKSTLFRALVGLVPQFYGGSYAGNVRVRGLDPARTPVRQMASAVGLVFQEPESQAVADTVEDDIAFGLEQRGMAPRDMDERVALALAAMGAGHLRGRRMATLSGGERQRVATAAVLAPGPDLLLLDEPTSQLDPAGAAEVLTAIEGLRRERGTTVLVAEHRLDRLLPSADRVVEVRDGRVTTRTPVDAAAALPAPPSICALGLRLGLDPLPLTVAAARAALAAGGRTPRMLPAAAGPAPGDSLVAAKGLEVRYGNRPALSDVDLEVRAGEIVALVGPNGSGKTTLLRALAGVAGLAAGSVLFASRPAPGGVARRTAFAGLCPQDPGIVLRHERVRGEVGATLRARRSSERVDDVLARWRVIDLADRDPRDLSAGQRQRVATAAMLAHDPCTWLMDEPTRGADAQTRAWLLGLLGDHAARGGCAIVATHDIEAAARFSTRVVGLECGRVAFDLPVRRAFGSQGPYPTAVARVLEGAMLPEDVSW